MFGVLKCGWGKCRLSKEALEGSTIQSRPGRWDSVSICPAFKQSLNQNYFCDICSLYHSVNSITSPKKHKIQPTTLSQKCFRKSVPEVTFCRPITLHSWHTTTSDVASDVTTRSPKHPQAKGTKEMEGNSFVYVASKKESWWSGIRRHLSVLGSRIASIGHVPLVPLLLGLGGAVPFIALSTPVSPHVPLPVSAPPLCTSVL